MDNNSLQHYGIPGMRWGVRRSKAQLRRARGPNARPRKVTKEQYEAEKAKAIVSGDPKKIDAWKTKLTKNELREAIDRCKMDTELREVSVGRKKRGEKIVKSVSEGIGTTVKIVTGLTGLYNGVVAVNNTFNKHKAPTIQKAESKKSDN
jgi:hypothetical protein